MKILGYVLALCFLIVTSVSAMELHLRWDANTETDLAGYLLYYKTDPFSDYTQATPAKDLFDQGPSPIVIYLEDIEPGDTVDFYLTGLDISSDVDYYIVVTAFDDEEPVNESGYSNEVNTLDSPPEDPITPHESNQDGDRGCFIGTIGGY